MPPIIGQCMENRAMNESKPQPQKIFTTNSGPTHYIVEVMFYRTTIKKVEASRTACLY